MFHSNEKVWLAFATYAIQIHIEWIGKAGPLQRWHFILCLNTIFIRTIRDRISVFSPSYVSWCRRTSPMNSITGRIIQSYSWNTVENIFDFWTLRNVLLLAHWKGKASFSTLYWWIFRSISQYFDSKLRLNFRGCVLLHYFLVWKVTKLNVRPISCTTIWVCFSPLQIAIQFIIYWVHCFLSKNANT